MQQNRIDNGEDCCIRADAKGKSQYRNGRESRRLAQHAKRVAKVLKEGVHGLLPTSEVAHFKSLRQRLACRLFDEAGFFSRLLPFPRLRGRQRDGWCAARAARIGDRAL